MAGYRNLMVPLLLVAGACAEPKYEDSDEVLALRRRDAKELILAESGVMGYLMPPRGMNPLCDVVVADLRSGVKAFAELVRDGKCHEALHSLLSVSRHDGEMRVLGCAGLAEGNTEALDRRILVASLIEQVFSSQCVLDRKAEDTIGALGESESR